MKANRITFDKIKAQYDILKMRAAYISAEEYIVKQAANGIDITGMNTIEVISTEEFHTDGFGNMRMLTPKEQIKNKMDALEEQGNELLAEEKYELFAELKEIYEKYKQEYDRL